MLRVLVDTDMPIVAQSLQCASQSHVVIVVSDDTDISLMLEYQIKPTMANSYRKAKLSRQKELLKTLNSCQVQELIGEDTAHCIFFPFINVMSGCDTTFVLFGYGKACVVKIFSTVTVSQDTK